MRSYLETIFEFLGLLLGIFGILLFDELIFPYELLCWIPISLGYSIWFGGWFK